MSANKFTDEFKRDAASQVEDRVSSMQARFGLNRFAAALAVPGNAVQEGKIPSLWQIPATRMSDKVDALGPLLPFGASFVAFRGFMESAVPDMLAIKLRNHRKARMPLASSALGPDVLGLFWSISWPSSSRADSAGPLSPVASTGPGERWK